MLHIQQKQYNDRKYIDFHNDKRISLCYNLVKALYFCRASPHNTSIIGANEKTDSRNI